MTTCPRCGAQVAEGARFCSTCGLPLEGGEARREERRIVTVLFADLVEFTAFSDARDPEDVKRIVDRAFEGLAEIVTIYGGHVDKILGDEIMAVFGAPQAHEDDPERAVRCALEMQRSLATYSQQLQAERDLTLAMRIGINTGEVMAGAIGGGDAYTVMGDAVNVASRLVKEAEPGKILVGTTTRAATLRAIEYREVPKLSVKGKAELLDAWEAAAERAVPAPTRSGREVPIIGREPELAVLQSVATIASRDRRPATITILGDAGMGKSRLVTEFVSNLGDARVLWGRSLPYGTASPSHAVEELVRAALDLPGTDDPATSRKRINERLQALGLGSEAERIATLAGVREPVLTAPRRGGGSGAGPAVASAPRGGEMAAALSLFEALAERDRLLVLVFQELHWADASVVEFVGSIADRISQAPVLVVALGRPELADKTSSWPVRPGSTVLHLLPLSRDAAAALLDALAGDQMIHPSVRENVLERSGGNPFFIEEFVRLLLDAPGGMAAVPASVQALVAARLDALDMRTRRIVQDAAVVGESFWPDALLAIEPGLGAETLDLALETLSERELIAPVEQPSLPDRREYRFRQTIVREVAYAALPKQVRAERHAAIGAWLEDVSCACSLEREFYDLVAYHFERAAVSAREVGTSSTDAEQKAREYLERAGDESMAVDAASSAAQFYERALEFARDDDDALHLRVHLGEAFVGSMNPVKAQMHLERAVADSRRVGERRLEGKSLRLLGDLARLRGELDAARGLLEQGLAIARETGDATEEAEGLRSHGLLDMFQGRVPAAPLWFRQALARYRELGDRRGQGWSLQGLGWANLLLGRMDEALDALTQGGEVFGEIGDVEGVGWCMGIRSWCLLFQGEIDEADAVASQIIELAAAADDNPLGVGGMGIEIERVLRAIVAIDRLQLSEAVALASRTFDRFAEVESNWGQAMARYPIGVAQILRCEIDAARTTMEEAMRFAQQAGDPLVLGLANSARAYVELEAGNFDLARRLGSEALESTERAGVAWISASSSRWIRAELASRQGDLAGAEAELADIDALGSSGMIPIERAYATLAEIRTMRGNAAGAMVAAQRAVEGTAQRPLDQSLARLALARATLLTGDATEALKEVDRALEVLAAGEWDACRVSALALKAEILDNLGRHDEAGETQEAARSIIASFPAEADTSWMRSLLSG